MDRRRWGRPAAEGMTSELTPTAAAPRPRWRLFQTVAVLLVAFAAQAAEASAQGTQPVKNGAIVVSWYPDAYGEPELRAYPANGSCAGLLAYGSNATFPSDASQLAFQRLTGSAQQIFVANSDGSGARQITFDEAGSAQPAFSPDGTELAFVSSQGGSHDVWTMDVDGGEATQLTEGGGREPLYSPDGSAIAFVHDGQIHLMNADGSGRRQLTNLPRLYARSLSFTPDGQKLVFSHGYYNDYRVAEIGIDGSGFRDVNIGGEEPTLSPDGAWYASGYRSHEKPGGAYYYGHVGVTSLDGTRGQTIDSRINWDVTDITWRSALPGETVECADFGPFDTFDFDFSYEGPSVLRVDQPVEVALSCNEPCSATLKGDAVVSRFSCQDESSCQIRRIRSAWRRSISLVPNERRMLRFRPGRKAQRSMRRAVRRGRRVDAAISADVLDRARGRHHEAELTVRVLG